MYFFHFCILIISVFFYLLGLLNPCQLVLAKGFDETLLWNLFAYKLPNHLVLNGTDASDIFESNAKNINDIISELKLSNKTERGTREDDLRSETSMEDRKKEGYF